MKKSILKLKKSPQVLLEIFKNMTGQKCKELKHVIERAAFYVKVTVLN